MQELLKIYKELAENNPRITYNPLFQKLTEMIAPFTQTKNLILWDFNEIDGTDVSPEFLNILEKSPHRVQILRLKMNESSHFKLSGLFFSKKQEDDMGFELQEKKSVEKQTEKNWYDLAEGIFEQSIAEAKRAFYTFSFNSVLTPPTAEKTSETKLLPF